MFLKSWDVMRSFALGKEMPHAHGASTWHNFPLASVEVCSLASLKQRMGLAMPGSGYEARMVASLAAHGTSSPRCPSWPPFLPCSFRKTPMTLDLSLIRIVCKEHIALLFCSLEVCDLCWFCIWTSFVLLIKNRLESWSCKMCQLRCWASSHISSLEFKGLLTRHLLEFGEVTSCYSTFVT